jgi:hypothetical protein
VLLKFALEGDGTGFEKKLLSLVFWFAEEAACA